jgi:hypothetical protein
MLMTCSVTRLAAYYFIGLCLRQWTPAGAVDGGLHVVAAGGLWLQGGVVLACQQLTVSP